MSTLRRAWRSLRRSSPGKPEDGQLARSWDGRAPVDLSRAPVVVTGTGRSGTHFFGQLLGTVDGVDAYHLDDGQPLADGFTCWASWQRLPMDLTPSMRHRVGRALLAERRRRTYVEANPLLGPSAEALLTLFPTAHFVVSLRDPRKVVESHWRKGWYANPADWVTQTFPYAYRSSTRREVHGYSRVLPVDADEHARFVALPRLGKLAWMVASYNRRLFEDLVRLAPARSHVVHLEGLSEPVLDELCAAIGLGRPPAGALASVRAKRPGKGPSDPVPWSEADRTVVAAELSAHDRLYQVVADGGLVRVDRLDQA